MVKFLHYISDGMQILFGLSVFCFMWMVTSLLPLIIFVFIAFMFNGVDFLNSSTGKILLAIFSLGSGLVMTLAIIFDDREWII